MARPLQCQADKGAVAAGRGWVARLRRALQRSERMHLGLGLQLALRLMGQAVGGALSRRGPGPDAGLRLCSCP